jgi:hypothetical protein
MLGPGLGLMRKPAPGRVYVVCRAHDGLGADSVEQRGRRWRREALPAACFQNGFRGGSGVAAGGAWNGATIGGFLQKRHPTHDGDAFK